MKRGHELRGSPSTISRPPIRNPRFKAGSHCARCSRPLFSNQRPVPTVGGGWAHRDHDGCRNIERPPEEELRAWARKQVGRADAAAIHELIQDYLDWWWHANTPDDPESFDLPPGVTHGDPPERWGKYGVWDAMLSPDREDLWARVVDAIRDKPEGRVSRRLRADWATLDLRESVEFVSERLRGVIDLPVHGGPFTRTDQWRQWRESRPAELDEPPPARASKVRPSQRTDAPAAICPRCFLTLPASGRCGNCE